MPTVLRIGAFNFIIYVHDHGPAHTHVFIHGSEAIIELNRDGGTPRVRRQFGCKQSEIKQALQLVEQHQDQLCTMWENIHGIL